MMPPDSTDKRFPAHEGREFCYILNKKVAYLPQKTNFAKCECLTTNGEDFLLTVGRGCAPLRTELLTKNNHSKC